MRQTLGGSRLATSFTAFSQTKGKSISRSVGKALDFSSSASSPTSFSQAGTNQGSTGSPYIEAYLNQEVELVVSCIILELEKEKEEEEEMTSNPRIGFKER